MIFKQYDLVRIVSFQKPLKGFLTDGSINQREPHVGDKATIVEVYSDPPGWELECCAASDGITTWLHTFTPDAIGLELVWASKNDK